MDSDDTQQPAVSEPAGQQLKRAREQKGLSLSAVADAQHLRPAVIQAIEDGNYGQIDSELFLKGYVRAYARQVDLDPAPVISTLDKELEPLRQRKAQAEELNPLVDIERRRRQKRHIAKLLFFVLIVAIAVFLGLRFLDSSGTIFSPDEPDASDAQSNTQSETGEPVQSEPDSNDQSDIGAGTEENANLAEVAPTGVEPVNNDLAVEDTNSSAPLDEQREIPLVVDRESGEASEPAPEPSSGLDSSVDQRGVPVVTSAPEPAFEESVQPNAAVGMARLEMTFNDECWVQVTDSAGNRLVGSLQGEGDRVEVSGRVPIEVIVGAVDAIESIRFDGESVDMSGFRVVNNRAEFSLDI